MAYEHAYLNTVLLLHSAIMLSMVKMPLKGEVGGHVLNSNGNYIVDHGKVMFLNFCRNPVSRQIVNTFIAVCFVVCHCILKDTVANIVDLHVCCLIWVQTVHG